MPDLSGIKVVHLLKQDPQTKSIPVIAVTVLARAADQERISLAHFDDYNSKPYAFDNLEATIGHHLREMSPP